MLKTAEGFSEIRRVLLDVGRSYRLSAGAGVSQDPVARRPCRRFSWASASALFFSLINIVGVEFLINFGGLGALINELAERFDLPGTYAAICFVVLVSVLFFAAMEQSERWLRRTRVAARAPRLAAIGLVVVWQALSFSGLFFRDVIPSLHHVAIALFFVLVDPDFWANFAATVVELATAMVIGGCAGLVVGFALGASGFLSQAYERWLDYLGPTPKIILFPVLIMLCGVGQGSKMAMGAVSAFFPIAISAAAGVRGVDATLLRVGRSLRASPSQMLRKIYLPAMTPALINGFRLGFGVAVIGVLLAETKLSKEGIGFMIIQAYTRFDMPRMYALLIVAVVLASGVNALASRLAVRNTIPQRG